MKELDKLKSATLKEYTAINLKKYLAKEISWGKSKRRRVVKESFITVYSTFKNRLLSRTFFLVEGYENKERYHKVYEVERMLAGLDVKLIRYLGFNFIGDVYFRCFDDEWKEKKLNSYVLDGRRSYYSHPRTKKHNSYEKFLSKSIHKYCAIEHLNVNDNLEIFKYLSKYDKHPQLEMLMKLGLINIYENDLRLIRWKQKGLKMLGIDKHELVYLQSGIELRDYRKIRKFVNDNKLTVEQAKMYSNNQWLSYKQLIFLNEKDISIYKDYIGFANKLGLVMNSKVKYPKNIKKEHDKLLKQITTLENKENDAKILSVAKKLSKLKFENEELSIFPAESTYDLIEESKKLGHCVRTYAIRIVNNETSILFIRKKEKLDKSLVTLELRNKKIVQVRAKDNLKPNKKIMNFVHDWAKKYKLDDSLI